MKKILVFGASSSEKSINKKLAVFAANLLEGVELNVIDLNDFEMPIFSIEREKNIGIPEQAKQFKEYIKSADGIIISFAEHNGSYSTAFKNIFDWSSRIGKSMWLAKPMFLMATSPGGRGGKSVLTNAINDFPHRDGKVIASFSLPLFYENFSAEKGIINIELLKELKTKLKTFINNL